MDLSSTSGFLAECERLHHRLLGCVARLGEAAVLAESLRAAPGAIARGTLLELAVAADVLKALQECRDCGDVNLPTGTAASRLESRLLLVLAGRKARYRDALIMEAGSQDALRRLYTDDTAAFGFRCELTAWAAGLTCARAAESSGDPSFLHDHERLIRAAWRVIGWPLGRLPRGLAALFGHAHAHPEARRLALQTAILTGDERAVTALLNRGLCLEARLACGISPRALAEGLGRQAIAARLSAAGARPSIQQTIVFAAARRQPDPLRRLLASGGSPHGGLTTPSGRCSPLEAAITSRGDYWRSLAPDTEDVPRLAETVEVLLEAGAAPHVVDAFGVPLERADGFPMGLTSLHGVA